MKSKRTFFDYELDFENINFREHPEYYDIGKGEQGVLLIEPYKGEILPFWRFKTPEIAKKSAADIYALFLEYKKKKDFVGMDMARKFIQMGYTRSRRYANHKSGRKYDSERNVMPQIVDEQKALSAREFYPVWRQVMADEEYMRMREEHLAFVAASEEKRKQAPRRATPPWKLEKKK